MPRHPPCALINLALAEIIFITRCSRPLCSSQITGRNQNRLELDALDAAVLPGFRSYNRFKPKDL
jgi:hypothetical protein